MTTGSKKRRSTAIASAGGGRFGRHEGDEEKQDNDGWQHGVV